MNTSTETPVVDDPARDFVHTTVRIDRRLFDELVAAARRNDRSVSAEIRQALRDYLRK